MTNINDLDDFKALEPFFRIIEQGLDGLADGGHFFDLLAEEENTTNRAVPDTATGPSPDLPFPCSPDELTLTRSVLAASPGEAAVRQPSAASAVTVPRWATMREQVRCEPGRMGQASSCRRAISSHNRVERVPSCVRAAEG
jgi:hypothetical protein